MFFGGGDGKVGEEVGPRASMSAKKSRKPAKKTHDVEVEGKSQEVKIFTRSARGGGTLVAFQLPPSSPLGPLVPLASTAPALTEPLVLLGGRICLMGHGYLPRLVGRRAADIPMAGVEAHNLRQ